MLGSSINNSSLEKNMVILFEIGGVGMVREIL